MIAADTSSLIAYFAGLNGNDVDLIDSAIEDGILVLPPPVLSELLSDPNLPKAIANQLKVIKRLPLMDNFWERVGFLRAHFFKKKRKARLADSMIAQYCIDSHVPLITRDRDFKKYSEEFKLKLLS